MGVNNIRMSICGVHNMGDDIVDGCERGARKVQSDEVGALPYLEGANLVLERTLRTGVGTLGNGSPVGLGLWRH